MAENYKFGQLLHFLYLPWTLEKYTLINNWSLYSQIYMKCQIVHRNFKLLMDDKKFHVSYKLKKCFMFANSSFLSESQTFLQTLMLHTDQEKCMVFSTNAKS